jgi:hypothetical protein
MYMPTNYEIWWNHAQYIKQNTKLLQVLTKQEEGDMQPAKISVSQNWTKWFPGIDTKHVEKYVELFEGFNMVARISKKPNNNAS